MKYRAEVSFEGKTARQQYNTATLKQRIVNENGFVTYNKEVPEVKFLDMVKRFEAKAQESGYYFRVDKKIDNKWITYTEVEV